MNKLSTSQEASGTLGNKEIGALVINPIEGPSSFHSKSLPATNSASKSFSVEVNSKFSWIKLLGWVLMTYLHHQGAPMLSPAFGLPR